MFRKALELHGLPSNKVLLMESQEQERSFRVLIVDDDPNIRRMMIAALKREKYFFFEAANGAEALDIMKREHPNVVVLDLMMPILSGWDVLRERSNDPDLLSIPIIIVSANRGPELATAIDKGICAFLPKPFDIGALSALVRSCLPA
jgi:two-component system, chemotaxis family, chemotaxis protein CheY